MKRALVFAALLMPSIAAAQAADQSADEALVRTFLVALKQSPAKASVMLSESAELVDVRADKVEPLDKFAVYANACKLTNVVVVPSRTRVPLGVNWICESKAKAEPEHRVASFRIDGDKITRIGWGQPEILSIERVN